MMNELQRDATKLGVGFTREDVDAIRLVHVTRPDIQARLESVADRIEALLPPEPATRDDGEGWEG